jgi:hypothetical protein
MGTTATERDAKWDEFVTVVGPYLRASTLQQARMRVQNWLEDEQERRRAGRSATILDRWSATLRKAEQRILNDDTWLSDEDKADLIEQLLNIEHQVIVRHISQRTANTEYELIDLRERIKWPLRRALGTYK